VSIDPLAERVINGQLEDTLAKAIRDAEYIRDMWDVYISSLRKNESLHLSGEPARLTELSSRLTRDIARYDGARDIMHTLRGDA